MNKKSAHSSEKQKSRLALISVITALLLAIIKLIFSILTQSLTLLASTVDSIIDIFASLVNFLSIKESSKPPDEDHRYGHGKIESLASLFQSIVIFGSALFIIQKAISNALSPQMMLRLDGGIIIMVISTIVSIWLTMILKKGSKKYDSQILKTDALHYEMDVFQNIGVIVTLVIVKYTEFYIIDAIIAGIIGLYIIIQVYKIFKISIDSLMDHELPDEVRKVISECVLKHKEVKDFHNLRTRKSGNIMFVNLDIVLSPSLSLIKANTIAHEVEAFIHEELPHSEIMIHVDPYDDSKHDSTIQKQVYNSDSNI